MHKWVRAIISESGGPGDETLTNYSIRSCSVTPKSPVELGPKGGVGGDETTNTTHWPRGVEKLQNLRYPEFYDPEAVGRLSLGRLSKQRILHSARTYNHG